MLDRYEDFSEECITGKYFFFISSKIYVVGTRKKRLNETYAKYYR